MVYFPVKTWQTVVWSFTVQGQEKKQIIHRQVDTVIHILVEKYSNFL